MGWADHHLHDEHLIIRPQKLTQLKAVGQAVELGKCAPRCHEDVVRQVADCEYGFLWHELWSDASPHLQSCLFLL